MRKMINVKRWKTFELFKIILPQYPKASKIVFQLKTVEQTF